MTGENTPFDFAAAKKVFSRIGFALIAFIAVSYAVVFALELLALYFWNENALGGTVSMVISAIGMYCAGIPVFYLLIKKIKPLKSETGTAKFSTLAVLFCIGVCFMYAGSFVGNAAYTFVSEKFRIYVYEATLEIISSVPWYYAFVMTVILAPFFEELVFRKLIISRTAVYGEKLAILFSAITFAFFHMSIQQFFYAFLMGLVLGYLYIRTSKLIYPIILHASINLFGSVFPLILMEYAGYEELLTAETPEAMLEIAAANPVGYAAIMIYSILVLALAFGGLALFFAYKKKLHFNAAPLDLPRDSEATVAFTGIGVVLFILTTVILPVVLSVI
ncbi:MAG: CPBP family intramembrane metalloprotease [Clostridia bacterium]|nr:CPBP family intramembrane metalloprotease [Clostridia bacterium]